MKDIAPIVAVAQDANATSAAIDAALTQARAAAIEAEAAHASAERAYQDGLLVLDDKALAKLATEGTAANVRRDRTAALVVKLETGLAEAQVREVEAARSAGYAAALAQRDAAVTRFREEYPRLVALGLDLLQMLAEADAAVEAVNHDLPAGAERLQGAEAVARTVPGLPREVIEDVEVTLWCAEGSAEPAPEDVQDRITSRGYGRGYYSTGTGQHEFVWQRFRRVTVRPAVAPRYTTPLAVALALPALRFGDALEWTPESAGRDGGPSPTRVLARLVAIEQAAAVEPAKARRGVEVEYLPVANRAAA